MGTGVKQLALILVLAIAVLATASAAFAGGGSVLSGHTSQPPAAQVLGTHPPKTPSGSAGAGTLPFTGVDLGVAAGIALILVAAGGVLRRSGHQKR